MQGVEKMKIIENINRNNFQSFGMLLEFEGDETNFEILVKEEKPWRLAVFRVWDRGTRVLECHPDSYESFEPLKGIGILLTAKPESPEDYHAFLLDKPVCLKKGVWHQLIALTEEVQVKITENLEVGTSFYELASIIQPVLTDMALAAED